MQKLLIVEDDQSVRTTMVTCLELEGYSVEAVSSTHEAIDRLEKQIIRSSFPTFIWMSALESTCCGRLGGRIRTVP